MNKYSEEYQAWYEAWLRAYRDTGKALTKHKATIPPLKERVESYCKERKNNIDPEAFIDHYEATGRMKWKNKVKDWQATIRTWEKFSKSKSVPTQQSSWWMTNEDIQERMKFYKTT